MTDLADNIFVIGNLSRNEGSVRAIQPCWSLILSVVVRPCN